MNRNTGMIVAVIFILVLIIGTGAYYLSRQDVQQDNNITVTVTPTDFDNRDTSPTPESTDGQIVPEDWETYENDDPEYSIRYPTEMEVTSPENFDVNFVILGETQREGTEVYNGISMTIESDIYEADTFEDFVQQEYEDQENQPTTSEITDLEETTVAGVDGHTFDVTSLGEFTHIYLPLNNSEYIHIFYIAPDPENQGYQDTVDTMLSSLEF